MRIEKREDELKAGLFREVRLIPKVDFDQYLLPIQDVRKCGTPDFTLNGEKRTSWWEVKHATPNFDSQVIQEVTCQRLARTSVCWYIIYAENFVKWPTGIKLEQFTVILDPFLVARQKGKLDWNQTIMVAESVIKGHDHVHVASEMIRLHRAGRGE